MKSLTMDALLLEQKSEFSFFFFCHFHPMNLMTHWQLGDVGRAESGQLDHFSVL